jgi:hypothetical protein
MMDACDACFDCRASFWLSVLIILAAWALVS